MSLTLDSALLKSVRSLRSTLEPIGQDLYKLRSPDCELHIDPRIQELARNLELAYRHLQDCASRLDKTLIILERACQPKTQSPLPHG